MKFDYADKSDSRLVMASPFALDYPGDVEWASIRTGVYMFIGTDDEVVYIGIASGGGVKDEIKARRGTSAERDAIRYRWFQTPCNQTASDLAADWIKKYAPRNNILGV